MGVELDGVGRQAHFPQQCRHLFALLRRSADALHQERFPDDRPHPHPGVERRVRVLEHELQVTVPAAQVGPLQLGEVGPVHQHIAGGGRFEADDQAAERRLPAP